MRRSKPKGKKRDYQMARRRSGFASAAKKSRASRRIWAHFAGRAVHAKKTPEERSAYGRALAKKRWDKVSAAKLLAAGIEPQKETAENETAENVEQQDDDLVV